jgi:two-component system CheB/CheR fusion protein
MEGGTVDPNAIAGLPQGEPASLVAKYRDELAATRSTLQATREQYESATEELRAANEELQSMNEEYRSTAEELETSKEELQSINEELQTLNNELKIKLEQVSRGHNDLQNLMSATDVSTMFLDTSMRIQRFTPLVAELFNIKPGDEGRPISDFTHNLDYQDLFTDAQRVLTDLVPIERTVRTTNDRWYMLRLRPYRTSDNRIEGIVAAFVDVTEHRQAEAVWEKRQTMLLAELSHRVKNSLAVVQAVTRLTLSKRIPEEILERLEQRISALASAHDILIKNEWRGAGFEALARQQLAAYIDNTQRQLSLSGPAVILPPEIATPLGLVLHELATNAAKYGALRNQDGRVALTWEIRDLEGGLRLLDLTWTESGGPHVDPPTMKGAGSALIEHGLARAEVERKFEPGGLVCRIKVPLTPASA